MEDVRLWKIIDENSAAPNVARVDGVDATATEKLLEHVLAHSPDVLMEGLTIIGRQNETQGGPLDLLGIDEDGRLVVFELKRGELTRLAVAQVLDYASWLDALEPEALDDHVIRMSGRFGTDKIDDFSEWYRANFGKSLSEIGRPRMVLVGLGVDAATKRMVEFAAEASLDISLITFYGFRQNGETLLARQVEVEAKDPALAASATKVANQEKLTQRLRAFGIGDIYDQLMRALENSMGKTFYVSTNSSGHTFYFPERTDSGTLSSRAFVGLNVTESLGKAKKIAIALQARAVETMGEQALQDLATRLHSSVVRKESGLADIVLDAKRPMADLATGLAALGTAVVRSWEQRNAKIVKDQN